MNIRCKIPILTTPAAHRPSILYNEGYNMLTKKEFDILVLLTESKEPMSQREIAEALGYSSLFSFSKFFKAMEGMPPLRFRQAHQSY